LIKKKWSKNFLFKNYVLTLQIRKSSRSITKMSQEDMAYIFINKLVNSAEFREDLSMKR